MTAERLKQLIEAAGSSDPELAQALGVSRQLVNYYTSGSRPIPATFGRRAFPLLKAAALRQIRERVDAIETLEDLLTPVG